MTLRNEEALAKEAEFARIKKRQKESILDDLVCITVRGSATFQVIIVQTLSDLL